MKSREKPRKEDLRTCCGETTDHEPSPLKNPKKVYPPPRPIEEIEADIVTLVEDVGL